MVDRAQHAVTELLEEARAGREDAVAKLFPVVYDELRRLARGQLRRERQGQSMQATALVNEAYLRLVRADRLTIENRAHFFGIAAKAMRQILVERARARHAAKRGGAQARVTFDEGLVAAVERQPAIDLVALDDALSRLAALDAQQARIVELRYFAGLTIDETAEALRISPATVKRDWTLARAWLHRELNPTPTT